MNERNDITQLLRLASAGDRSANDELFSSVYQELRAIAHAQRRRWHGNDTLNTTTLIHEAYLKLADSERADYRDRAHFLATASRAMRQILINYAERSSAAKRGGDKMQVTLSDDMQVTDSTVDDLLAVNTLLEQLEQTNARHCRLLECRVFGGMTIKETATALGVSPATVKRDWLLVSAWAYREMKVMQ